MTDDSPALRLPASEPTRLWLRLVPRSWPDPGGLWIDVVQGAPGRSEASGLPAASLFSLPSAEPIWLPPVDRAHRGARDELARELRARGGVVAAQVRVGETVEPTLVEAVDYLVYDPLEALVREGEARFVEPPAPGPVVWPLVAGLTDERAVWEVACERLAAVGFGCVQALRLTLAPRHRQLLLDASGRADAVFDRLFHAATPSEREFARVAASYGLTSFFRRSPEPVGRAARNLAAAEMLALAGELWLRLERSEAAGQELFRSSRWAAETPIDVRAAVVEGNLDVLPDLGESARLLLRQWAEGEEKELEDWLRRYEGRPREGASSSGG